MEPVPAAPEWVTKRVLPQVGGHVRSVQMVNARTAVVLAHDQATVAQKGLMSGVKVYRVAYPVGFLVNESRCPHCHEILLEPVAKVAKLAKEGASHEPTEKQIAQRKYAAGMRTIRARAKHTKGGSGPVADRSAAQQLRRKLGIKKK